MDYFLLDNSLLLIGFIAFCYISYLLIFKIERHDIEPDQLVNAYFLIKRRRK